MPSRSLSEGRWVGLSLAQQIKALGIIDRCLALVLGLLTGPIIILALAVVATESKGSPLFRQERLGLNQEPFRLLKIRTMFMHPETAGPEQHSPEASSGSAEKVRTDPRITPTGQFLRRWSIDELPQLWNVVAGHMSLVGPRPILPQELQLVGDNFQGRFDVLPGITGLAQVRARARLGDEHFSYDLTWAENRCLSLYFRVLLVTVPAVLRGDNAY